MTIQEVWAIPLERTSEFFRKQPGVVPNQEGFTWQESRIILTKLPPRPMGPWPIPQTQIRIEGPEEQARAIYKRFFMTFVSAGG